MMNFKNFRKKHKKLFLIILIIAILAVVAGVIFKFIFTDVSPEEFRQQQLVNGRYYYLKTKITQSSNVERAFLNGMRNNVYSDKYFKTESITERWEDLQTMNCGNLKEYCQKDMRNRTFNKNGEATFDRAFIGGNYFVCRECSDKSYVEEEVPGELPISEDVKNIFAKKEVDPWRNSIDRLDVNGLYYLQSNHNYAARKKTFYTLKYAFWDDVDFLGKVNWEGKEFYGFRVVEKNFGVVTTMYFYPQSFKYAGEERVSRTYNGDGFGYKYNFQKIVVLEERYSDNDLGVNSDGLLRESEGEINQMLDRKCETDIDCDGILDYTIAPGSCPPYFNRCVGGQCALMCMEGERKPGSCTKYDKEMEVFISYSCLGDEKGVSRLVKEKDGDNGLCKVSDPENKTIVFCECIDNEKGEIELLKKPD